MLAGALISPFFSRSLPRGNDAHLPAGPPWSRPYPHQWQASHRDVTPITKGHSALAQRWLACSNRAVHNCVKPASAFDQAGEPVVDASLLPQTARRNASLARSFPVSKVAEGWQCVCQNGSRDAARRRFYKEFTSRCSVLALTYCRHCPQLY